MAKSKKKKKEWKSQSEAQQALEDYINDKIDNNQKIDLGMWGEFIAAIDIFKQLEGSSLQIKSIKKSGGTPDLRISFKNFEDVGVEVKSSKFKNDYLRDFWMFGVALKKKDITISDPKKCLIAMINAFVCWKGSTPPETLKECCNTLGKDLKVDTPYVALYFSYSDINETLITPVIHIPVPLLPELKERDKECMGTYTEITPSDVQLNYYKGINLSGNLVFNLSPKIELKKLDICDFPSYHGKNEKCRLFKDYRASHRALAAKIENDSKKYLELEPRILSLSDSVDTTIRFDRCPSNCNEMGKCKEFIEKMNLTFP